MNYRILSVVWSLAAFLSLASVARADFAGPYAPAHWTLTNTNADGTVDLSLAPGAVRLIGGDNRSGTPGVTEWKIVVTNAGMLQFGWSYSTADDTSGPWDRAGWRLNQSGVELARNDSTNLSGQVSVHVGAGDEFAFWVRTEDNMVAPGELTVTNFIAGALSVPPRFLCVMPGTNEISFQFESIPGRTYRIESVTELPSTNWVQVGTNILAVANPTEVNVPTTGALHRFYRAVLLP